MFIYSPCPAPSSGVIDVYFVSDTKLVNLADPIKAAKAEKVDIPEFTI